MGTSRHPQRASHTVAALPSLNASDRLDSLKEIATYLKRTVRTVQRWEKREGLPVHRQFHLKEGTVWALMCGSRIAVKLSANLLVKRSLRTKP